MMEEPTGNEEPIDVQSVANVPTVTEPSKVDSQEQRAVSNDVERPAKTGIESEVRISEEPIDMLTRDQKKALPMFVSVTDSILAELKQFVANERMPYEMGGLEAYKAAYVSLKSRAIEYGKGAAMYHSGCEITGWFTTASPSPIISLITISLRNWNRLRLFFKPM